MTIRRGASREILFNDGDLRNYLGGIVAEMLEVIESLSDDEIRHADADSLAKDVSANYIVPFVALASDEHITTETSDTMIDITGRFDYVYSGIGPSEVKGTQITLHIPFTGQRKLLSCTPNQVYMAPPVEGSVSGSEILLGFRTLPQDQSRLAAEVQNHLKLLRERLEMMRDDVENQNNGLFAQAKAAIETRKTKLQSDNELATSLGFKLHIRDDTPKTYIVPEIRHTVTPLPQNRAAQRSIAEPPEPTVSSEEYTHILSVVKNMVRVMELSPNAFAHLDEEALRFHFLVQLNGQYEGQATGETFNYGGKTDILISYESKNLFVAECKFWRGAQSFKDALDQLLGYASWRDGKLALLIFNRNKNLTAVLEQIPALVHENGHYIADVSQVGSTEFHYTFAHPSDKQKHLTIAILVFEVPGADDAH